MNDNTLFKISDFIFNKSVKAYQKILTFFIIVLSLVYLDNITGFTNHYDNSRKLTEIKTINEILQTDSLNLSDRTELKRIRSEIINDWDINDYIKNQSSKVFFNINIKKYNATNISANPIRNIYLEIISTNWFILFLFLFLPPFLIVKRKDFDFSTKKFIAMILAIESLLFVVGFILFYILSLIPTIFGKPWINYILNFSITLIIVSINTYRLSNKN